MKAVAILFYFSFDSGCCYINDPEMGSEDWPYAVYFFTAGGCLLAQKCLLAPKANFYTSNCFKYSKK